MATGTMTDEERAALLKAQQDFKDEKVYNQDLSELAKQQPGSAMDTLNAGLPGSASNMAMANPAYAADMKLSDIAPEAIRTSLASNPSAALTDTVKRRENKNYGLGDYMGIYSSPRRSDSLGGI